MYAFRAVIGQHEALKEKGLRHGTPVHLRAIIVSMKP